MDRCTIFEGKNKLATCKSGEMIILNSSTQINARISMQGCFGKLKVELVPGNKYYVSTDSRKVSLDRVESLSYNNSFSNAVLPQETPSDFISTKKIWEVMEVDENNRHVIFLTGFFGGRGTNPQIYRYSDILEFELLENGSSVTKGGLGRALVFGALAGGVGAIVGGVTGSRKTANICESLSIKITVNNINNPAIFINLITSKTKMNSSVYKEKYKTAQEALSLLNVICTSAEVAASAPTDNQQHNSPADEIAKYKSLLDCGAITIDEYESKKKQLLNL